MSSPCPASARAYSSGSLESNDRPRARVRARVFAYSSAGLYAFTGIRGSVSQVLDRLRRWPRRSRPARVLLCSALLCGWVVIPPPPPIP